MRIVCLGSGNVAWHLSAAFKQSGSEIVQVWSRDLRHAEELALAVHADPIDNLDLLDKTADLFLIAVKDDAIPAVALYLKNLNGLVVHTSGATSIQALAGLNQYGVLYPLQTFSKQAYLDLTYCPMCLEANSDAAYTVLEKATSAIGKKIYKIDSEQREVLHVAAVFAANFSNQLYHLANTILQSRGLSFDLLRPLILEAATKVQSGLPFDVQTGPAVRNDQLTMERHLNTLQGNPELQNIYETISDSIKKTHL
jgi:predicted short-subunit dehydrogenase-like oxidoreductase (DUF2520 family)